MHEVSKRPFRLHHLLLLLETWEKQGGPLDNFLRNYFRLKKAIGSKDRKWIAEKVYEWVRWQLLVDSLIQGEKTWEKRIETLDQLKDSDLQKLPLSLQLSCPQDLFNLLVKSYGEEEASKFCKISNERAPVTLRVNTLKTTRAKLMDEWKKDNYVFSPCQYKEEALHVQSNLNFFALPEFKAGHFELQDEGSQCIADLVKASANDWVLDYCAGAGGKSLAIAAKMQNKGQLFLHDVRKFALQEAKKRMSRAGVQNAQFLLNDDLKKKRVLKHKMQWVLVDAPCTGTGTLRRNPDLKSRFSLKGLEELRDLQYRIFSEALDFVKTSGFIVYATCSVLKEENQEQAARFEKDFVLKKVDEFFSLPQSGEMDGFYGVVFKKLN